VVDSPNDGYDRPRNKIGEQSRYEMYEASLEEDKLNWVANLPYQSLNVYPWADIIIWKDKQIYAVDLYKKTLYRAQTLTYDKEISFESLDSYETIIRGLGGTPSYGHAEPSEVSQDNKLLKGEAIGKVKVDFKKVGGKWHYSVQFPAGFFADSRATYQLKISMVCNNDIIYLKKSPAEMSAMFLQGGEATGLLPPLSPATPALLPPMPAVGSPPLLGWEGLSIFPLGGLLALVLGGGSDGGIEAITAVEPNSPALISTPTSTGPITPITPITPSIPTQPIPEPLTILGALTAIGFGAFFKWKLAKK
jgi:hypothetical protein